LNLPGSRALADSGYGNQNNCEDALPDKRPIAYWQSIDDSITA
jgi:hypothetical protein